MTDKPTVSFEDFLKLDLRVATVLEVHEHPNADKLLVLTIDLGDQQRQIIAGLRGHYQPQDLTGKQLVIVANLEPRKMRGLESQGMLLAGVYDRDEAQQVVVLTTDTDVPPGTSVS